MINKKINIAVVGLGQVGNYLLNELNKKKRDIYLSRMSGIVNSILGRKSWYRPSLD